MFITFEGPEGSGKTTQITLLADALRQQGFDVHTTREPGGVPLAEQIRELVLHGEHAPEAEALLFLAARAEHVRAVLQPTLARGTVVICDRFTESTLAYQGYGLGLDLDRLRQLCDFAAAGLTPDVTFLLDLSPDEGLRRRFRASRTDTLAQLHLEMELPPVETSGTGAPGSQEAVNKMENRALEFHRRVREGFLKEAERDPRRIITVDASRSVKQVHRDIWRETKQRLRQQGLSRKRRRSAATSQARDASP